MVASVNPILLQCISKDCLFCQLIFHVAADWRCSCKYRIEVASSKGISVVKTKSGFLKVRFKIAFWQEWSNCSFDPGFLAEGSRRYCEEWHEETAAYLLETLLLVSY